MTKKKGSPVGGSRMCAGSFTLSTAATPKEAVAAPKQGSKPNIVLINMDNFGYGELGCEIL